MRAQILKSCQSCNPQNQGYAHPNRPPWRISFFLIYDHQVQAPEVNGVKLTLMINQLRSKIATNQFEFSKHALDQSILRVITVQELREAIADGEVIEDYPDDKYGPSCLVLGTTKSRRPIHIQCSYPSRQVVKIITLYQPDPLKWIDYKVRRN